MFEIAIGAGVIALVTIYSAWREYTNDNPRDAKLLAAFGIGTAVTAAGLLV